MTITTRKAMASALAAAFLMVSAPAAYSADPAPATQAAIAIPDLSAMAQDPVHQAAIKESANHKIVFVLGEGFGRRPLMSLKNGLSKLGFIENQHYKIILGASAPREAGVIYVDGQSVRRKAQGQPLVFDQYDTETAVIAIENLVKKGSIVTAQFELGR